MMLKQIFWTVVLCFAMVAATMLIMKESMALRGEVQTCGVRFPQEVDFMRQGYQLLSETVGWKEAHKYQCLSFREDARKIEINFGRNCVKLTGTAIWGLIEVSEQQCDQKKRIDIAREKLHSQSPGLLKPFSNQPKDILAQLTAKSINDVSSFRASGSNGEDLFAKYRFEPSDDSSSKGRVVIAWADKKSLVETLLNKNQADEISIRSEVRTRAGEKIDIVGVRISGERLENIDKQLLAKTIVQRIKNVDRFKMVEIKSVSLRITGGSRFESKNVSVFDIPSLLQ